MHFRTALIGLLATGVLSSPLSVDKKTPSTLTTPAVNFVPSAGIAVRQDKSGCPMAQGVLPLPKRDEGPECADPSDPWPFCDGPDDDKLNAKNDKRQSCADPDDTWPFCDSDGDRTITARDDDDDEPVCICVSQDGDCVEDTEQACYPDEHNDRDRESLIKELSQDLAWLQEQMDHSHNKRQNEPFCMCATHGNGTCIAETEYCLDHPDLPPHKPLCMCSIDSYGFCKEGTTICSDNVQTGNSRRSEDGDENERWCVALPSASGTYNPIRQTCARDETAVRDLLVKRQTDDNRADCVCVTSECNEPEGVYCFTSTQKEHLCDCSAYEGCSAAAKVFCHFTGGINGNGDHNTRTASIDGSQSQLTKRQGVTEDISPDEPNPTDGTNTWENGFGIVMYPATEWGYLPPNSWHNLDSQCYPKDWLLMSLTDGKLTDNLGRKGYIASNGQLQFDDPPQAGAKWTSGFFTWGGVLGLGSNYTWWACSSGGFSNLYSEHYANYCQPVWLKMNEYDGDCPTSVQE